MSRYSLSLLESGYYGRWCQWERLPALCPTLEGWVHDRDCEITVKGKTYRIDRGDRTNLGSVPWFARWLVSVADPAFVIGFIWHDRLCGEFEEPLCTWTEANEAMYWINKEMSQHLGWLARFKRHLVFMAVEFNGLIKGHY